MKREESDIHCEKCGAVIGKKIPDSPDGYRLVFTIENITLKTGERFYHTGCDTECDTKQS